MPFLEIFRRGRLVKRQEIDPERSAAGLRVRLGTEIVHVKSDTPSIVDEWEAKIVQQPTALPAAEPQPEHAPTLPGYELLDKIGEGGMGVVWKAIQLGTKRRVAIKFLGTRAFGSERSQRRFEREVELSAKLEHPNVARIYDSGVHKGVYYYAMELIHGLPLDEFAEQNKVDQKQSLELIRTVCLAVQHAHERGVIHRDLKPGNILISADGQPHVLDFGLAKSILGEEGDKPVTVSVDGSVSGTPAYMSPEQAAGKQDQIDARSDVYSLGVLLYRLLVKKPPHDLTGSYLEVMRRIVEQEITSPRENGVPLDRDLEAILFKALAQSPANRYANAGDFATDITNYLEGEALSARRRTPLYLLGKRIKRYRVPLAFVASLFAVAIIFGVLPGGWLRRKMPENIAISSPVPAAAPAVSVAGSATINSFVGPPPSVSSTSPASKAPTIVALPPATEPAPAPAVEVATPPQSTSLPPLASGDPARATPSGEFTNSLGMKFVEIKPGSFLMGSPVNEPGRRDWETQHKVTLTKRFFMAATPVTRGKFAAFVRETAYQTDAEKDGWANAWIGGKVGRVNGASWRAPGFEQDDDHPVVEVSRNDATAFVAWLNKKGGQTYRLPTEAEYEYCCRAGTQTVYPWGDNPDDGGGWANCCDQAAKAKFSGWEAFNWNDSFVYTSPVASFKPNAFGLYDMVGNVWEWCSDWYGDFTSDDVTDPQGTAVGTLGVLRGGSWALDGPSLCRCARRNRNATPSGRDNSFGFRLALDADGVGSIAPIPIQGSIPNVSALPPQASATAGQPLREFPNSIGMKFVEIKPGSFLMGSPDSDTMKRAEDTPQHKVTLTKPFYMGVTDVTVQQFQAFVSATGYRSDAEKRGWGTYQSGGKANQISGRDWKNPGYDVAPDYPVAVVTWDDANRFCDWLSSKDGRPVHLPTEAQWEYACRAGTTTIYQWGDDPAGGEGWCNVSDLSLKDALGKGASVPGINSKGVCNWRDGFVFASPVARLRPNAWGLFDMHGNVWEWCSDWYQADYYNMGDSVDPQGPAAGVKRVIRGGCFDEAPRFFRSASRLGEPPDIADFGVGFRVVMDADTFGTGPSPVVAGDTQILADLGRDWSDSDNPQNGWSYQAGRTKLISTPNWKTLNSDFAQPAWLVSDTPTRCLPAWFKAAGNAPAGLEWRKGDVIVHTTDSTHGKGNGDANVTWTSNFTGPARIDGYVWSGRNIGGNNLFCLRINNHNRINRMVPNDGTHNRDSPYTFSDPNVFIRTGEAVELEVYSNGPEGDFVGASLTISRQGVINASARPATSPAQAAVAATAPSGQISNSIGMKLVEIQPGSFLMGSPLSEQGRSADETQHRVTLTRRLYMATTPVTQGQWKMLMNNNPSHFHGLGLPGEPANFDRPVEQVNYGDALVFCDKLSQKEGAHYRLPSEAEWEYACRAGTTTEFYTGDGETALDRAGWYEGNSNGRTHPVGQKQPNAWGLFDMHGNVCEWCSDWYGSYTDGNTVDPQGVDFGRLHVVRGGTFLVSSQNCRSAFRHKLQPDIRGYTIGFRPVMDADSAAGTQPTAEPAVGQSGATSQPTTQVAPATAVVRAPDTSRIAPAFEDDFVHTRLWNQGQGAGYTANYLGGAYDIQVGPGIWYSWRGPPGTREDFVGEMQVVFNGAHPNAYCGISLFSADKSSLAVMVNADGQVRIVPLWDDPHKNDQVRKQLPAAAAADAIKPDGAINTLTVRMKGATCEAFLNGIRVIAPVDVRPFGPPATLGYAVQGGPAGGDFEFRSYRVWLLKDHPELAN